MMTIAKKLATNAFVAALPTPAAPAEHVKPLKQEMKPIAAPNATDLSSPEVGSHQSRA